jgi:hypothetical protein
VVAFLHQGAASHIKAAPARLAVQNQSNKHFFHLEKNAFGC